jgi:hypothetical protein
MNEKWLEIAQKMAEDARAGVAIERKRLIEILAQRQRKQGSGARPALSLSLPTRDVSQPREHQTVRRLSRARLRLPRTRKSNE